MEYTRDSVTRIFQELGEVMFVLESDREYELHGGSGKGGNVELHDDHMVGEGLMHKDNGDTEYVTVWISYDAIEHHYTHREI